jgi:hypothetical protein
MKEVRDFKGGTWQIMLAMAGTKLYPFSCCLIYGSSKLILHAFIEPVVWI